MGKLFRWETTCGQEYPFKLNDDGLKNFELTRSTCVASKCPNPKNACVKMNNVYQCVEALVSGAIQEYNPDKIPSLFYSKFKANLSGINLKYAEPAGSWSSIDASGDGIIRDGQYIIPDDDEFQRTNARDGGSKYFLELDINDPGLDVINQDIYVGKDGKALGIDGGEAGLHCCKFECAEKKGERFGW